MTPDSSTAVSSPSIPNRAAVVETSTMNAPAGPPICARLPPRRDTIAPPMMAAYSPRSGPTPDATAIAMDSGRATTATVTPAPTSARKSGQPYPSRSTAISFGS